MPTLSAIYHYPVKGFNGISLDTIELNAGGGIPNDRRFAITRDLPTNYDGSWLPPKNFTVNARVDNIQKYRLNLMDDGSIEIESPSLQKFTFHPDVLNDENREIPLRFVEDMEMREQTIPNRLVEHNGGQLGTRGMWDYPDTEISIINLATTEAIAATSQQSIDPLRFRGNLLVEGISAWQEYGWIGKIVKIGDAVLEVLRPIDRCPATSVNPETGHRDFDMPAHLQETTGHVFCGVYARVISGGEITPGADISIESESPKSLEQTFSDRAPAYSLWPRIAQIDHRTDLGSSTLLTLRLDGPWQFPIATPNQRVRIHIPGKGWTGAPLERCEAERWMIEISPSPTSDPLTEFLRREARQGDSLVVSGPYGRPK